MIKQVSPIKKGSSKKEKSPVKIESPKKVEVKVEVPKSTRGAQKEKIEPDLPPEVPQDNFERNNLINRLNPTPMVSHRTLL